MDAAAHLGAEIMSFISYAQNFEDVMLHRALGHIESGFYVDVGAQHAVRDSVTAAFYERGWQGINIEPVPKWARMLRRLRPRDINLELAIHPTADAIEIHEVPGGLSTSVTRYAERYRDEGLPVRPRQVAARRLDDVLAAHAGKDIHFLKIDVEGAEPQVLESLSLEVHRPWILVIEATRPGTPDVVAGEWEHLVTQARYRRVYWDGLNVFYVAEERMALAPAFSRPPNVFDQVQLAETVRTITRFARRAHIVHRRAHEAAQRLFESEQQRGDMASRVAALEQAASRVPALERDVARIAGLEQEVARIPGLEQDVAKIAGLEQEAARIPGLEQELARIPGLEREVARIAGLEQDVARIKGLEDEIARLQAVELQARQTLDRMAVREEQNRVLEAWAFELEQQGRRGVAMRRQLNGELGPLRAQAARAGELEQELAAIRGSSSWLVTAPLRLATSVARHEIPPREAARRIARGSVRALWVRIRHRTQLAQRLQRIVAVQPRLHAWLQRAATHGEPTPVDVPAPAMMGVRARAVFDALSGKRASEQP